MPRKQRLILLLWKSSPARPNSSHMRISHGVIFLNPDYEEFPHSEQKYLTADEYLSGNVREKLRKAEQMAEANPEYKINAEYLQKVQPKDLTAGEISVKSSEQLGYHPNTSKEFVFELLSPNYYARDKIDVKYSNLTENGISKTRVPTKA